MANHETSQSSYLPSALVLLVERIATTDPAKPAAHFRNVTLSYRELNAGSRLLAARLRENGLESGAVVCVCLPAGPECLMALLAIFRIGGIYVPLNPDHPKKYLEDIIAQAAPSLVITQRKIVNSVLPSTIGSICCDDLVLECDDPVPLSVSSPDATAAILFTSGSTGKPKGVLLTCENLAHLAAAAHDVVELESSDIFCSIARNTFSISFFDLLVPITLGASVRFVSRDTLFDFDALIGEIKCSTVMHAGPALLSALHRHLESAGGLGDSGVFGHMRHVSTGGDMVLPSVMTKMKQLFPQAELFVFYGCTEIACMGTFHQFAKRSQPENVVHTESGRAVHTESGRAIVGRPFPGMEVFLIGEDQKNIENDESGSVGEIVFAGRGVAAGYLNQQEQTIRQFGTRPADPKVRSYRTGDFGRWTSGGSLEILGRRDFQVQVRGVRVELAAIENRIIEMGLGTQCIVMERCVHSPSGLSESSEASASEEKVLIAFIVARGDVQADSSASSIAAALSQEFPREMIPSRVHFLEAMPLNHNGKIDRKALASMELPSASATPSVMSSLETGIAAVFKEELGLSEIGTDDNFFTLGGHSLKAVLVVSKLAKRVGVRVSIAEFFLAPSVGGVARAWELAEKDKGGLRSLEYIACQALPLGHQDSAKPSIYLLAGANIYKNLAAQLAADWCVFSLVSEKEAIPISTLSQLPGFSVEELAEDYYQAIIARQPKGPYTILGHSFGGVVAYHLATLMVERGHELNELIMVDALLPEWALNYRFRFMQVLRLFRSNPVDLFRFIALRLSLFGWRHSLRLKLGLATSPQSEQIGISESAPLTGVVAQMDEARVSLKREAAIAYIKRMPRHYPRATLFLSKQRYHQNPLHGRYLSWNRYIPDIKPVWIDAGHSELIQEQSAIEIIQLELRRIRETVANR